VDLKEGPVDRDTYHPQVGFRISSGDDIDEFDGDFAREAEQDAESGDIDQDFPVTGDNSNQCVGTQGVANTGNAQDAVSLGLLGGDYDDLEIDEGGASIEVDGSSDTS
jgi:hypothetical protein